MPTGNTSPIFTAAGRVDWNTGYSTPIGATANTNLAGVGTLGTNVYSVFTAGPNGSFVQRIRFKSAGTTAATCMRVFVWDGSSANPLQGRSNLIDEITLPITTITASAATAVFELPLNFVLPATYQITVTSGASTGAAGTGWYVTVIGGDY